MVVELQTGCITVPCDNTDAESVHEGLDLSPQTEEQNVCNEILSTAFCKAELDGSDGAYPNRRYDAWRSSPEGGCPVPRELLLCLNHSVHIPATVLERFITGKPGNTNTISRLQSFVSLLRTANYFLRMISVVPVVVNLALLPMPGMPSQNSSKLGEFMRAHMVYHFDGFKRAVDGTSEQLRHQCRLA